MASTGRASFDTANTATAAPMRVAYGTADRCLTSCVDHASWPDTPWDQDCGGPTCGRVHSPTFWTTKRLSTVTTQVWGGSAYKDVDRWMLAHTLPDPGDGTRAGLWLEAIGHTGKATGPNVLAGNVVLPEINFDYVQLPQLLGDGPQVTFNGVESAPISMSFSEPWQSAHATWATPPCRRATPGPGRGRRRRARGRRC